MKTAIIGILGLLIIGLVASTGVVSAWGSEDSERPEHRQAIIQAIEDNDFDAWKIAMEESLTEERFAMIVERHSHFMEHKDLRFATRDAIMDGDYDAYLEAVEELGVTEHVMTEEDFNNLVEMHQNGEGPGFFKQRFGRMMHFFGEN